MPCQKPGSVEDEVPCYIVEVDDGIDPRNSVLSISENTVLTQDEPVQLKEIHEEQKKDTECHVWLRDSYKPSSPFFLQAHFGMSLLYHRPSLDESLQLCIPKVLREHILHLAHHSATAGHPGGKRMYQTLLSYYWPLMSRDVAEIPKRCTECIRELVSSQSDRAPMQLFPAPGPLEFVAIDILGPLPKVRAGMHYVLVIMDRFSKLVRTVPLKNITADTVCNAFIEEWVHIYGAPAILLSDNGTQFTSRTMLALCRYYNIKQVFTNPYHPHTNGQVERLNKTLTAQLRVIVAEDQKL
jgi:hypothetical protein